jgi:hypothetical protein
MYPNLTEIKKILGRQYSSKGTKDKEQLRKEIEPLLPNGFIILTNHTNGYLYITRI